MAKRLSLPAGKVIKEHKHLTKVLHKAASKDGIVVRREAEKQSKELKEYQKKAGRRGGAGRGV